MRPSRLEFEHGLLIRFAQHLLAGVNKTVISQTPNCGLGGGSGSIVVWVGLLLIDGDMDILAGLHKQGSASAMSEAGDGYSG
eukprot:4798560-Prymnesium_polylepis.1